MAKKSLGVRIALFLVNAGKAAFANKWGFLGAFFAVLLLTTGLASHFDLLPNPIVAKADEQIKAPKPSVAPLAIANAAPEQPTRIEIPAIALNVTVSNPNSTDVEVLDNALLTGAVRYPSSSNLGEPGNVIIFGHSSYLPIVHNQAFKAFDGIQKLTQGDRITVTGTGHTYVYSVDGVRKASATEDSIPLTATGNTLTLATCNSFGQKTDRFIVTATLVETDAIGAQATATAVQVAAQAVQ